MTKKEYTIEDVCDVVGQELTDRMKEVLGDEKSAAHWFYTPIIGLGNVSPCYWYKRKGSDELEKILGRIEDGVYS